MNKLIAISALTLAVVLSGCAHERHHARPPVARPMPAPLVQPSPVVVHPAPVVHTTTYVVEPPPHHHHVDPHRRPRGVHEKPKAPPKPIVKPAPPKPAPKPVKVVKPAPPQPKYVHPAPVKAKPATPPKGSVKKR